MRGNFNKRFWDKFVYQGSWLKSENSICFNLRRSPKGELRLFFKRHYPRFSFWIYRHDEKTRQRYRRDLIRYAPKKHNRCSRKWKQCWSFLAYRAFVHYVFILARQTVNRDYYPGALRHVTEEIRRKQPEIWTARTFHLHYDNHSVVGSRVFSKASNCYPPTTSLFAWPITSSRLFFFYFQNKIDPERKISDSRGHNSNTTDDLRAIQRTSLELRFQRGKDYGRSALLFKKNEGDIRATKVQVLK
jgi:hypothetical protein